MPTPVEFHTRGQLCAVDNAITVSMSRAFNGGYLSHDIVPGVAAAVVSAARPKGRRRTVCGGPSGPEQVGAEWPAMPTTFYRCLGAEPANGTWPSAGVLRWLSDQRYVAAEPLCCDGRSSPPASVSYSPMVGRRFSTLEKGLWRVAKQTRVKCTGLCAFSRGLGLLPAARITAELCAEHAWWRRPYPACHR